MTSIRFPKMFNQGSTLTVSGREATSQNLRLLVSSESGEFTEDPYFGVVLRSRFFDQNGAMLADLLREELFEKLRIFMPQVSLSREDITIKRRGTKVIASINCINRVDFTTNTLELALFDESER